MNIKRGSEEGGVGWGGGAVPLRMDRAKVAMEKNKSAHSSFLHTRVHRLPTAVVAWARPGAGGPPGRWTAEAAAAASGRRRQGRRMQRWQRLPALARPHCGWQSGNEAVVRWLVRAGKRNTVMHTTALGVPHEIERAWTLGRVSQAAQAALQRQQQLLHFLVLRGE